MAGRSDGWSETCTPPHCGRRRRLNRRLAGAIVVVGLAATACATDAPDEASIIVSGRVTDADGSGLSEIRVEARSADELQGASARINALGELGLACVDERPPPECADRASGSRTGDDGGYAIAVSGTEAPPGVIAGPVTVEIAGRAAAGPGRLTGSSAATVVQVGENQDIGDLTLWQPSLELSTGEAGDAVFRWSEHPTGDVDYRAFAETSDGRLLWDEVTSALEVTFPAEALRGTAGGLSVVARSRSAVSTWRSPRVPYVGDDEGVRPAGVDEVSWPTDRGISEVVVLVAIIGLLVSSAMLVMVAGSRHRRSLRVLHALPMQQRGEG